MRRFPNIIFAGALWLCGAAVLLAQPAVGAATKIPPFITFSGTFIAGHFPGGGVKVRFTMYGEESGGTPLWTETQTVQADAGGHYTVTLGTTSSDGIPPGLFASGQPRWLGIQTQGEVEQPRFQMVSVPYALKAADAETLGGLPPSAFALAPQPGNVQTSARGSTTSSPLSARAFSPNGITGFVPLWTDSSGDLGNSAMYQSGSGGAATVGINTTTPATALDVKGAATVRGLVSASSYLIGGNQFLLGNFVNANAFIGFAGNSATTGIANTGVGDEALWHNTTGSNNTGDGTLALSQNTTGAANTAIGTGAMQSNTTGTYNTALGYQALSSNTTSSNNTATGSNALYENNANDNTADGYQALVNNYTGILNTAVGAGALILNTSGSYNTAFGASALATNSTGDGNTAVGYLAGTPIGLTNQSGLYNTFVGYQAAPGSQDQLINATAIGANSIVNEDNALILGGTGAFAVSVGIGTATPYNDYALDIEAISGGPINGGIVSNSTGGNIYLGMTNGAHKFRVDLNGVTYADGGFQSTGADFAESFAVRGERSLYEPGDVLEIDRQANRRLTLSRHPYAKLIAGIYSTQPGLLATPHHIDAPFVESNEVPLAVVGIVPCKVTTENGAIARGDLLVTSSRPGYAMKGTDRERMLGAVLGKALEPLRKGTGVIQVLVTQQ
jgi:hypothetical protein